MLSSTLIVFPQSMLAIRCLNTTCWLVNGNFHLPSSIFLLLSIKSVTYLCCHTQKKWLNIQQLQSWLTSRICKFNIQYYIIDVLSVHCPLINFLLTFDNVIFNLLQNFSVAGEWNISHLRTKTLAKNKLL